MKKLHIILDNIRSAYNVGSIFRTADGAGGCEVHICGMSPTPSNAKVLKTSLGSTESVPWNYFKSTDHALEEMREKNIPVYLVEISKKALKYNEVEYPEELAIILGHETEGVSRHILENYPNHIMVPMRGKKESLNVATTAGIVIYEIQKE